MTRKGVLGLATTIDKKTRGHIRIKKHARKKLTALSIFFAIGLGYVVDALPDMIELAT